MSSYNWAALKNSLIQPILGPVASLAYLAWSSIATAYASVGSLYSWGLGFSSIILISYLFPVTAWPTYISWATLTLGNWVGGFFGVSQVSGTYGQMTGQMATDVITIAGYIIGQFMNWPLFVWGFTFWILWVLMCISGRFVLWCKAFISPIGSSS